MFSGLHFQGLMHRNGIPSPSVCRGIFPASSRSSNMFLRASRDALSCSLEGFFQLVGYVLVTASEEVAGAGWRRPDAMCERAVEFESQSPLLDGRPRISLISSVSLTPARASLGAQRPVCSSAQIRLGRVSVVFRSEGSWPSGKHCKISRFQGRSERCPVTWRGSR